MFNELFIYGDQNLQVPAHLNFGKLILDCIRRHGNNAALEHGDTRRSVTYKELAQYAVNMADALIKLGVKRGDVVGVGCEKRFEFVAVNIAILFTGASYTPLDFMSGLAMLKHKISLCKPKYMICSRKFWDLHKNAIINVDYIKEIIAIDNNVESITCIKSLIKCDVDIDKFEPVEVQGQIDIACILYSSGTTGMSKAVLLTHLNCIVDSLGDQFKDDSLQTALVEGEWYHNYDTFMTYRLIVLGKKVVYLTKLTSENILRCIDYCKINIAFLVPYLITRILKVKKIKNYNLDSLQIMYSASSPLQEKTVENIKFRFPNLKSVLQGYGMTEAGEITSGSWETMGSKPGSAGMVSPGVIIKVVDPETHATLGPNRSGIIRVKGSVLMKGYLGTELSNILDEEGFFNTDDLGYYDEDKYFYITGRLSDTFVCLGDNVNPLEIEIILLQHPAVQDAGVVGQPNAIHGEEPVAFVVKQAAVEVTEIELIKFVAPQVPYYMKLRAVKFVDEIPKNPRGKIMRQRLREML